MSSFHFIGTPPSDPTVFLTLIVREAEVQKYMSTYHIEGQLTLID